MKFALGALCSAAIVVAGGVAHADGAREVATRVADQWRAAGAKVTLLSPKFLFDDDRQLIALAQPEDPGACTYVAFIAGRGVSFRAKLSDAPTDPLVAQEPSARGASAAGVVELRRCDRERPVKHVEVSSDAGRGAIEIVVAYGPPGLPSLAAIIPERTGGPAPPAPDAGPLSAVSPMDKRIESAEQRAKRDGASIEKRTALKAGEDGTGETDLDVGAGCYRFEVVGRERPDRNGRRYRLDVDAELRDGDRLLARDRTEAPDARLEGCVGRTSRLSLVYAGAMPGSDVVITRGSWPLPARLPSIWGPGAKSRMARVMFVRHVAVPAEEPVFLLQGASGTTPFSVPVETGGCYVAVAGVTHGRARQLQLRTSIGARESVDERGAGDEAALSAFCVGARETVKMEVLARPSGVAWGLALYRVKSGIWEPGR